MNRTLSILTFLVSLTALCLSLFLVLDRRSTPLSQAEINNLIQIELDKRDHDQAVKLTSKYRAIYKDMLGNQFDDGSFNPQTVQELLTPLMTIIAGFVHGDEPKKKTEPSGPPKSR